MCGNDEIRTGTAEGTGKVHALALYSGMSNNGDGRSNVCSNNNRDSFHQGT